MRRYWLLAGTLILASCTRSHYRKAADRAAYPLVVDHTVVEANAIGRIDLTPAPESRLFDPYNPDRPPKPPDDTVAALFMKHPYRFRGSRRWEKDGALSEVEPLGWEESLGREPDGMLKLTNNSAYALALTNSREYQTGLERVYLSALALTLNRFEFDSRWFGRSSTTYSKLGFAGPPDAVNTITTDNGLGFNRNLAAGGQLLVDFANSFVWEFTGNSANVTSTLSASLVQPILRGFGRKVRLESLTQAERDTLYAIRDFARFRKQFWVGVSIDSGGYLSLLLLQQSVRNAEANLRSQEENYQLGLELLKGNKKSPVEVDAIFQGLLSARQQVVNAQTSLQEGLDRYKLTLGLPPRIPVQLDDEFLKPFELVAPELEKTRADILAFGRARNAELGAVPTADSLRGNYLKLDELAGTVTPHLESVAGDLARWKKDLEQPAGDDPDAGERRIRAAAAFRQQSDELTSLPKALAALRGNLKQQRGAITEPTRETAWRNLNKAATQLDAIIGSAITAQQQARIYLIRLPEVSVFETDAVAHAKANRLDYQNKLAQVTDAWRKVTVAANRLQGDLNLIAKVDLLKDPDNRNPFDFSQDVSRYNVGLQFDSPLNRVQERNAYRTSLIAYQRARRDYMELGDQIEQQIRSDIRTLRLQKFSFEIARQSLIAAARQLENEQLLLNAPNQVAANTGDATLRKLRALEQLLAAREQLAGSFIRYEQQRVRLLLDLEELQLDERGFPTNARPALRPGE